jgi:hypothetical protein
MRIRYFVPDDEVETTRFTTLLAAIDDFWKRFVRVSGQRPESWISDLRATLGRVNRDLGLEVTSDPDGTQTMIVVPLGGAASWPLAELCVERAPRRMPWCFEARRAASSTAQALQNVRKSFGFDLGLARARVGVARGHLLEAVLASPEFTGSEDERAQAAAEVFLSLLVGDHCFESWLGRVSVQPAPRPSGLRVIGSGNVAPLPLAIDELGDAVRAAVNGIALGLPETPLHVFCERAEWTLFELDELLQVKDAHPQATWEGTQSELCETPAQSDLLMAATSCPEALKCLLSGERFSSERFSRHGERFCYLKLRVDAANDEARVQARSDIEDALDRALVPGRLGCVVGSGLGREHVYVDLALNKVDPALNVVKSRLARLGIRDEAWLFFFDDEWSNEWVGLTPKANAPSAR